jgi:hypothetical protein
MLFSITMAATVLLSTSATVLCHARGLDLNVDIGVPVQSAPQTVYAPPPPPVYVAPPPAQVVLPATPPQFVYVPELGYYVAIGIASDMIYDGSAYYYHNNGYWYRTAYYGAPWQPVAARALPTILVRFNFKKIHRFRDREYRLYSRDREHYKGQLHRPEFRKEERREERHEERNEGRGRR